MSADQPAYSRDELVANLTAFYQFLEKMYLPWGSIKYPPNGGWSEISASKFDSPKDEAVIDLLRHIPYLREDKFGEACLVYEETASIDYTKQVPGAEEPYAWIEPDEGITVIPSHVVAIASTRNQGRNGWWFFLDTLRGTITKCDFQVGPNPTELSQAVEDLEDIGVDPMEEWREYETYTVKDFFEMLEEHFTTLKVIPIDYKQVRMNTPGGREVNDLIREIYHEHGWPSQSYRKEECMRKVKARFDELE